MANEIAFSPAKNDVETPHTSNDDVQAAMLDEVWHRTAPAYKSASIWTADTAIISSIPSVLRGAGSGMTTRQAWEIPARRLGRGLATTTATMLADATIDAVAGVVTGHSAPSEESSDAMKWFDFGTMLVAGVASMKYKPLKVAATAVALHTAGRIAQIEASGREEEKV